MKLKRRPPYIEGEWKQYRARVVASTAGRVQVAEERQSFFAGALLLNHTLMTSMSDGDEATEADLELAKSIEDDLRDFRVETGQFARLGHVVKAYTVYQVACLPAKANRVRLYNARLAFVAGALALWRMIGDWANEGRFGSDRQIARAKAIDKELSRFGREIDAKFGYSVN